MEFKLHDFVKKSEMKDYTVIRNGDYDYNTGTSSKIEFVIPMFIYKKTLKVIVADTTNGLYEQGQLNGKCLKVHELKKGDTINVEGFEHRVVEIFPRLHADFVEFVLELVRYD